MEGLAPVKVLAQECHARPEQGSMLRGVKDPLEAVSQIDVNEKSARAAEPFGDDGERVHSAGSLSGAFEGNVSPKLGCAQGDVPPLPADEAELEGGAVGGDHAWVRAAMADEFKNVTQGFWRESADRCNERFLPDRGGNEGVSLKIEVAQLSFDSVDVSVQILERSVVVD